MCHIMAYWTSIEPKREIAWLPIKSFMSFFQFLSIARYKVYKNIDSGKPAPKIFARWVLTGRDITADHA
jgi:hypothetical protein